MIYNYFDYRKYLKDAYQERHKGDSNFSLRFLAGKIGIDHSYLVRIFKGQKHLSMKAIQPVSKLLKLSPKEHNYFELLVLFGRSKHEKELQHYFSRLVEYADIGPVRIEADKYAFYLNWYHSAIRELIGVIGFKGNYAHLSKMLIPSISAKQAKESIQLLESLKLIHRDDDGIYRPTSRFITASEKLKSTAIRTLQKQMLQLAGSALDTITVKEREISTVTISVSEKRAEEIKTVIQRCRKEILRIAYDEELAERVYQVNFQLFPLSRKKEA